MFNRILFVTLVCFGLTACASKFPNPSWAAHPKENPNGTAIFEQTFSAHGGDALDQLNDLSVSITGKWKKLIRKIQPLVTDFKYRVESQERVLPTSGIYAALYQGSAGTKKVVRTPDNVDVYYNQAQSTDSEVLSSTALTADSFHLFLLGPLALEPWRREFTRLTDITENGVQYYRIHTVRIPGLGFSERDEVVLWVNPDTKLTYKVQITLEGHSTTQGAHVETAFLDYEKRGPYVFPSRFFEKVNAPIAIDAHGWRLTGLDINRGLTLNDLQGKNFSNIASAPAKDL